MKFNKIKRGAKRENNNEVDMFNIIDSSFICHVSFSSGGRSMILPMAYGRSGNSIYLHGSSKNHMLNQILDGQTVCLAVTHLDGIVLARNLFHSSVNYRSVVVFGKVIEVVDPIKKSEALTIISEHIIKGRSKEVPLGSESEILATMVLEFEIESASVKIRTGGPMNDDHELTEIWSGHIPLELKAGIPVQDMKFNNILNECESLHNFIKLHS